MGSHPHLDPDGHGSGDSVLPLRPEVHHQGHGSGIDQIEPLAAALQALGRVVSDHAAVLKGLAVGSAAFFVLTPLAAPALIILMPADILVRSRRRIRERPPGRRILFVAWHAVKNLIGAALILLGILLLFLPGQGLLTLFAGVVAADLPGKKRLLALLLGSGRVRPLVDRLRERHRRDALIYPDRG